MSFWRRHQWTADEITVARELLIPGWHDATRLGGGYALAPRKAKRIADNYVDLGYARRKDRLGRRSIYKAKNAGELTKIAERG